jgi:hypothetical protein
MIPQMTKVGLAVQAGRDRNDDAGVTEERFRFGLSRHDYEREWGVKYDRPGFRSKFLALVLRVIPKIGPFRALAFKLPTPEAEALFITSFQTSVDRYRALVANAAVSRLTLDDRNFDTGKPVHAGDYERVDAAYEALLERLEEDDFRQTSPALRADLLRFLSTIPEPTESRDLKKWRKAQAQLEQLKALTGN